MSDLGRETIASIFAHQSPTKGGRSLPGAEDPTNPLGTTPPGRITQNPLRRQSVSSVDGAEYEYQDADPAEYQDADPAGESEDV